MKPIQKLLIIIGIISFFSFSHKSINYKGNEPFRGFMIDAPRGIESMEYYFRLIDFCHEEGFNSIIFRLTDDEGSAYHFKSHPELKTCTGAFTDRELKKLVKYAKNKDIEMIPEVESFGHAKYIIETDRYKFLDDGAKGNDFNSVCPVSDTTLNLMKDLYSEIATIFPSHYFHIGCDEVNWGASEMSKKALKTESRQQIWANYVNTLDGYLKALGKKTIIWGDVPIYHEKEVLNLLNRDIVIMDWNYWETNKKKVDSVAHVILNAGFHVIGCPAVSWCAWGPRVGKFQFKNINAYAEVYCNLDNPNNLGIILSNWVPLKYIQNSQWDTYTIAAKIIKNKGNYNYMDALPAFIKNHFDATWDANWGKIYKQIYEKAPQSFCAVNDSTKFFPWSCDQDVKDILEKNTPLKNPFSEIKSLLLNYKDRIKKNKGDFNEFLLTIEFLEYNYIRQNQLLAFANSKKTDMVSITNYLTKVALGDHNFIEKINAAWNQGRRSKASEAQKYKDYMMSIYMASNYSKKLSENPVELIKMIIEHNK